MSSSDENQTPPRRAQPKPKRRPRPTTTSRSATMALGPSGPAPTDNGTTTPLGAATPHSRGNIPHDDSFFRRDTTSTLALIAQSIESPLPGPSADLDTPSKRKSDDALSSPNCGPMARKRVERPARDELSLSPPSSPSRGAAPRRTGVVRVSDDDDDQRSVSLTPPPDYLDVNDSDLNWPGLSNHNHNRDIDHTILLVSSPSPGSSPSLAPRYSPESSVLRGLDPELEAIATQMRSQLPPPSAMPLQVGHEGELTVIDDDLAIVPSPRLSGGSFRRTGSSHNALLGTTSPTLDYQHGLQSPPPLSSLPRKMSRADSTPLISTFHCNLSPGTPLQITIIPRISFQPVPDPEQEPVYLPIYVPVSYRVQRIDSFEGIFTEFCTRYHLPRSEVVMTFRDTPLFDRSSPASLDWQDEVEIFCYFRHTFEENKRRREYQSEKRQHRLEEQARLDVLYIQKKKQREELQMAAATSQAGVVESSANVEPDEDDENEDYVKIKLRGKDRVDVKLKAKHTTTVKALIDQYVKRQDINSRINTVKLEFEGDILDPDMTVEELDLEDGDMLTVIIK
ncbi:hypothetical protein H4R33_003516 [Dimargaris cristalligena]|nr:hypothetical protein H4R33_003516 [Dimargaris cristalligena]